MDIDTLTFSGSDFEELLMTDTADNMSSEEGGAGDGRAGDGSMGSSLSLTHYNYTALESMVSEVWEGSRPGVHLHEAAVLLLSALVVGVHGLLGLLPRSLLTTRTAWLLLHAGLGLGCLYGLACISIAVHNALCRRLFRDDEDGEEEEEEEVEEKEAGVLDLEQSAAEDDYESIVSAQLEKDERVQRWIDNLVPDREQVNLEACGEIKGRNMEAEVSGADLLGDGQPASVAPDPASMTPRVPRNLPLPPPPQLMAPAEVAALSKDGQRALSLAYELSLAVRKQTTSNVRATMSAPGGNLQALQALQAGPMSAISTLAEHKDAWKLVRRGKETLDEPVMKTRSDIRLAPNGLTVPDPDRIPASIPTTSAPIPQPPQPVKQPSEPLCRKQPSTEEAKTPQGTPPGTPKAVSEAIALDAMSATAPSTLNALNPSSSLLSFVRRFSGTRFLLRDFANATADGLQGLRLWDKDSRSLSLPLEPRSDPRPGKDLKDPGTQRSALVLPRVQVVAKADAKAEAESLVTTSGRVPLPTAAPHREKSVDKALEKLLDKSIKSNVMKVFSKGILSEGTIDISTTSIQDSGRQQAAAAIAAEANGALSLLAQEAAGIVRTTKTTTTTTATCTTESETFFDHLAVATPTPTQARSTLNLGTASTGARARPPADLQDDHGPVPVTTSRGLTANMSEEGIPRPVPARPADLDDEHKSLFDLKKSLLTSIPEAAPPDEDIFSHYF